MRFTRVTLFFIAFIITLGFYQLARHFLAEVEPQTFQATEEVMVDMAHLLAEWVEEDLRGGQLEEETLRHVFEEARGRRFEARIFDHLKTRVGVHVYVTDERGVVLFDSDGGRREGADLSAMRDVALTLAGRYGARSSREDEANDASSVLFVSAPIGDPARPLGVLTVFKPQADVLPLVRARRQIIYTACALIGGGILFLIAAVFLWLFRPIGRITEYARAVARGDRPARPKLGAGREVNTLAEALDSMREALEGRRYAERYIQTLTHEIKSPLAAIRGAAELLDEDPPAEVRQRFVANIRAEVERATRLSHRLLELAAVEGRQRIETPDSLDLQEIISGSVRLARPLAEARDIRLDWQPGEAPAAVAGEAFLLRAAVSNLLENAVDFSPQGGRVSLDLRRENGFFELSVTDEGPGVPEYARERVFERFYSLRHHSSGRKGTGLGLTLVREAAELHGGSVELRPAHPSGTIACLRLPEKP